MLRLAWRLLKLFLLLLILAGGLYVGGPFLLAAAGRYLVTTQPLTKADLVLVLSGEPYLRAPEAAKLYHEGLAPAILLTTPPRPRGLDDLLRAGIQFPDEREICLKILEALRVPRDAILTIAERSDSTGAEAGAVARFLKRHPARSLIVVTSKSHSTRARKILGAGLGSGVRLLMHPVPSDPFDPDRWWKDRMDTKEVLHEYEGLADYWCLRLWDGLVGYVTAVPPPVSVR
jgi:uncharacterized SAM-binding protein YcdF (DUF218 family)